MATQKRITKLLTGSASQADTQDADTQALLTEADLQALLLSEADMQRLVLTEADLQALTWASATAKSKHKTD